MRYTVRSYINEESFRDVRVIERMKTGLLHEDYCTPGPTFEVEAESEHGACEELWQIGNRIGTDLKGRFWPPRLRSLSIGDLCKVGESAWVAVTIGWRQLEPEEFAHAICTGLLDLHQTDEEAEALQRSGFCPSCKARHEPVRIEDAQTRDEMEAFLNGINQELDSWEQRA